DELAVLISHRLWVSRFGADENIPGTSITFGGRPHTVIGVMPRGSAFPSWADVWIPLSLMEDMVRESRQFHPLEVVGRLREGVTVEESQAEVQGIAHNLSQAYPKTNGTVGAMVVPLHSHLVSSTRPVLVLLLAAVAIVLLIACVNVANLFAARAAARCREVAVRSALGASRRRLIRQLLTESLLLAGIGGALGVLLAFPIVPLLVSLAPETIPGFRTPALDLTVLAFAGMVTVVTALIFGTLPAWRASDCDLVAAMKSGASTRVTARRSRSRDSLAAVEIALAVVVLASAGLLVKSFVRLQAVEPGFDSNGVLTALVPLRSKRFTWEEAARFYREDLFPKLRALPGVEEVAVIVSAPLTLAPSESSRFATRFGIVGHDHPPGQFPVTQTRWISQDYFRVLRIPLERGRLLTRQDQGQQRVVVNRTFAQRFFSGRDPVGEQLLLGVMGPEPRPVTIVGVVGDARGCGLDRPVEPTFYSVDISPGMTLLVRT
ncbi:MAG: FtsX-like permease family protein, partial [bacterium]|nr:FtsX-like permease family protein [bacterium]